MGNAESAEEFTYSSGYQVLKVQHNSPGQLAGLENFFDVIVRAGDVPLDQEDNRLVDILFANVEQPLPIIVYSSKTDTFRETYITPSMTWGGKGLIGVSIRYCQLKDASEHVWHILDVYSNSPAEAAGLRAYEDYIVGTPEHLFADDESFFSLVAAYDGKPLSILVYNKENDSTRTVTITPSSSWGGSGSLGCDVGYGLLHRIPTKDHKHTVRVPPPGAAPLAGAPATSTTPGTAAASVATTVPTGNVPVSGGAVASAPRPQRTLKLRREEAAKSVFVSNVSAAVDIDRLKSFFSGAGTVVGVTEIPPAPGSTNHSVYVEYSTSDAVAEAIDFSGVKLGGATIEVSRVPAEYIQEEEGGPSGASTSGDVSGATTALDSRSLSTAAAPATTPSEVPVSAQAPTPSVAPTAGVPPAAAASLASVVPASASAHSAAGAVPMSASAPVVAGSEPDEELRALQRKQQELQNRLKQLNAGK